MNDDSKSIEEAISRSERIGTIGSPSSTAGLSLDIMGTAVNKKLLGELAFFEFYQDGMPHYSLGQITEVILRNIWLEDPTIRSLARQKGIVNPVSGQQDTHLGQMTISSVFSNKNGEFAPSILGTVPPTGTYIHLATDELLNKLLERYKNEVFYLGHVYGSIPKLPLWFKDFSTGPQGVGEAYHIGIFGKTGSGKSVLAKMILLAYARYKDMGIFVLDPQGEFALSLKNERKTEDMKYILDQETLAQLQKKCEIYDLNKLKLSGYVIFVELLREYKFFFELGIKDSEYQEVMADYVIDFLKGDKNIKLEDLSNKNVFIKTLNYMSGKPIERVYAGKSGIDRVKGVIEETLQRVSNGIEDRLLEKWLKVSQFFQGNDRKTPEQIVWQSLYPDERPLIVIDLSQKPSDVEQDIWDRKIKPLLIDSFLEAITRMAEFVYHKKEQEHRESDLNTLVLIDEAHRLAPREKSENERLERIKSRLIDAVRTTRKYGLGWMFISQTLSSLDKEIVEQLRIMFFGFGLALGTEFQSLRELVGGDPNALKLYQSFRDPASSFSIETREYSFMTIGPVSPLSFAGTPLFFTAFNKPEYFLNANSLVIKKE